MKKRVMQLVLALMVGTISAQATTIFEISFDVGVQVSGPAPNPYPGTGGDILAGSTNVLNSPDGINYMISSTGPQGGMSYRQSRGATWPNKQGYTFGNLPTSAPSGGGGPNKFVAVEYTIEALVKPDFSNTGFGLSPNSSIFDSAHLGDGSVWGDVALIVNQNTGQVSFFPSADGGGNGNIVNATNNLLTAGQWYHIAAVVRTSGVQRMELWINGELAGTGNYPVGWETQDLFRIPGYFNVGGWYWSVGRNWQGEMDAFAISDVALSPGSFVLPEPNVAMLASLAGMVLLRIRRRR